MGVIKKTITIGVVTLGFAGLAGTAAHAALTANSQLTQVITAGTASTSIRDASGAIVTGTPAFAMTATTVSTTAQTSTGVFGSDAQRITVDNPGAVTTGTWNLSLNATVPGTGVWTSGSNTYLYNGTAVTGQLTINPAAATPTYTVGTGTGLTLGTAATFTGSTPITLWTAASGADDVWNGFLTGIGVSQVIPASTPAGTYVLNMTQTLAVV